MIDKEIINKSIDYIIQHFDEDISIGDVAEHFNFSKYYFCRSFKEVTGESVYAFIKRLKMDQSAIDIKQEKDKSITDIGLDYGYSASNYSSAFKNHHNISPEEFRKDSIEAGLTDPFGRGRNNRFMTYEEYDSMVNIRDMKDQKVIYQRIIGNYIELKERWSEFIEKYKDQINKDTLLIERFYDDPSIAQLGQCICDLCISIDDSCRLDNVTVVCGGKFAVFRFEGEIKDIYINLQGLFSIWMPQSGYKMDGRCGLNIYKEIDWAKGYVVMDFCIPIK